MRLLDMKLNDRSIRSLLPAASLAALLALGAGCETKSFLDPSEVGRYKTDPLTVKILDDLGPGDEATEKEYANATPPTQADLEVSNADYAISAGDQLTISVADLVGTGAETIMTRRVSESGKLSLQLLREPITAEGMTEIQLQDEIVRAYRDANIITDAQVSVMVVDRQGATFNILGAIGQPGRYPVPEADFRLLDAIVLARDITATVGIDDIYIIRKLTSERPAGTNATEPATTTPRRSTGEDPLAPRSENENETPVKPVALMQADTRPRASDRTAPGQSEGRYTIIDGQPVMVRPDGSSRPATDAERRSNQASQQGGAARQSFNFNEPKEPTDRRVIRVPWEALRDGSLKYNVVIRPDDIIYVPQPIVGEYYMGGHVSAPGAYSLSGRKITLTQAVIAARMLDPLAIPRRTEIRRRINDNEVLIARVDLQKVFQGVQPDLYLRPNDSVSVGTNALAPFLLAVRNGFRVAYGFGFLYDRNFYEDDNNRFN